MASEQLTLIVFVGAGAVLLAAVFAPRLCCAPISKPPFRGCRRRVIGLFGFCRDHGSRPGIRLIRMLGGQRLLSRRVCDRCGQSRVFQRMQQDGTPYLGCVGVPTCKNPRMPKGYRF